MANKYEIQQSEPLHIENTVLNMGKEELRIGNAFCTYRDMKLDGVISGSMSFIKGVISKEPFKIGYHSNSTAEEKKLIDALNRSLNDSELFDKQSLMSGWLSMLDYGLAMSEVVLKRDNGKMVFANFSPIHPTTVQKFVFKSGQLKTLELNAPDNDGLLVDLAKQQVNIKGDKILMFRNEKDQDFPLGKSLMYGAYTAWRTKKILQEYEAIGVAKNLSGVLNLKIPSTYLNKYLSEPASDEALYVGNLIDQAELLHAGKGSFILTASDTNNNGVRLFDVDVIGGSGGNAMNFNVGAVIERYNREIMLSLQTTVLATGANGEGGSFALSDNQTNLLTLFIEYIRKQIGNEFKKAIRMAFKANGLNTENIPDVEWSPVQNIDWQEFSEGWSKLVNAGAVSKTEDLEAFIRKAGNAPEADYSKRLVEPEETP